GKGGCRSYDRSFVPKWAEKIGHAHSTDARFCAERAFAWSGRQAGRHSLRALRGESCTARGRVVDKLCRELLRRPHGPRLSPGEQSAHPVRSGLEKSSSTWVPGRRQPVVRYAAMSVDRTIG